MKPNKGVLILSFLLLAGPSLAGWCVHREEMGGGDGGCFKCFATREEALASIRSSGVDDPQWFIDHMTEQDCGGGGGGTGGGADPASAGASQAGAAIGQAIVHGVLGYGDSAATSALADLKHRVDGASDVALSFANEFYTPDYSNTTGWIDNLNRNLAPGYTQAFFQEFCPPSRIEDLRNRELYETFYSTGPVQVLGTRAEREDLLVQGNAAWKSNLDQAGQVVAQGPVALEVRVVHLPGDNSDGKIGWVKERTSLLPPVENTTQRQSSVVSPQSSAKQTSPQSTVGSRQKTKRLKLGRKKLFGTEVAQRQSTVGGSQSAANNENLSTWAMADAPVVSEFASRYFSMSYINYQGNLDFFKQWMPEDQYPGFVKAHFPQTKIWEIQEKKLLNNFKPEGPARLLGVKGTTDSFKVKGVVTTVSNANRNSKVLSTQPVALEISVGHYPGIHPVVVGVKEVEAGSAEPEVNSSNHPPQTSSGQADDGVNKAIGDISGQAAKKLLGL